MDLCDGSTAFSTGVAPLGKNIEYDIISQYFSHLLMCSHFLHFALDSVHTLDPVVHV
eukprot:TRINITY_DN16231_c0_g1_i1.p1 TRINITY_DN16231_c0_g1~~TRINITY_DN16231_c0_g1_i1.p1  ORF type:complete len:57 (-),score=7.64 TRINITY_DN16231_c0_g1_i1:11-181(-)